MVLGRQDNQIGKAGAGLFNEIGQSSKPVKVIPHPAE